MAVALAVVAVLHPVLDTGSYLVFMAAVVVASAVAGFGPGLLASGLAIVAVDFFFLLPLKTLRVVAATDVALLALFGAVALIVAWTVGALHRGRARLAREAELAAGITSLLERQNQELERDLDAIAALRRQAPRRGE